MIDATLTDSSSVSEMEGKDAFRCKVLSEPSGVVEDACFARRVDDEDSRTERGVARAGEPVIAVDEGDNVAEAGLACCAR